MFIADRIFQSSLIQYGVEEIGTLYFELTKLCFGQNPRYVILLHRDLLYSDWPHAE